MRLPIPLCPLAVLLIAAARPGQGAVAEIVAAEDVTPAQVEAVRAATRRALERLRPAFPVPAQPFKVVVHAASASLPAALRESLHEDTPGVAFLGRGEVHLIADRMGLQPPNDLTTILRHELVHVLLHQLAGPHVPRWFHEGLAQVLAGWTYLGVSEEDIVFHAGTGNLLPFPELESGFPRRASARRTAYAQSFSFVSFLQRRFGLPILLEVAAGCGARGDFGQSFRLRTGERLDIVEEQWIEHVVSRSGAAWRVVLQSCFGLSLVAALPLLALAGARRWNRDDQSRRKLAREEEGAGEPSEALVDEQEGGGARS